VYTVQVEQLARDVLRDPVRINVGSKALSSNEDIQQIVTVLHSDAAKWSWLIKEVS
jgi:superfamily II DNA/RNA helicase